MQQSKSSEKGSSRSVFIDLIHSAFIWSTEIWSKAMPCDDDNTCKNSTFPKVFLSFKESFFEVGFFP
jgi:hypothetical protein